VPIYCNKCKELLKYSLNEWQSISRKPNS
jgi:hypothetical protein